MWRNAKLFTLVRLITLHVTVATSYLQSTTIANVTVIDVVRGEVNPDMTIVVTGNRISQLGSSNTVVITDGTRIVDGRGKFIIPGLWDMHVHLGYATEASIPVMIASGITGVRDMGSPSFETLRRWRVEAAIGRRSGHREPEGRPMNHGVSVDLPQENSAVPKDSPVGSGKISWCQPANCVSLGRESRFPISA